MTRHRAKRAAKARAVAIPEVAMPEAPWLVAVPPELIGDPVALAQVVGSHRLAFDNYRGPVVVSASSPRMTAELVPAIYAPARGHG